MAYAIMDKLPISVLVTTKNEEVNIARCLNALHDFDEYIVIDSCSTDRTAKISKECGAEVVAYRWNGQYPKKRQWCLDHLDIKNDWVFWVDADEVVTEGLVNELRVAFSSLPEYAGFFVRGRYIWDGVALKHGLKNNKLALFHKAKVHFPAINDLDIEGMGEIEGHYQPILKPDEAACIGQLNVALDHYAYDDLEGWRMRHERYAIWEAEMIKRQAYPKDPIAMRDFLKNIVRTSVFRPYLVFLYSFLLKFGVLDGADGYNFAKNRMKYAKMVFDRL